MKLCRFTTASDGDVRIGLVTSGPTVVDVIHAGVHRMTSLIERPDLADELARLARAGLPEHPLDRVRLLTPVESQEVWAAGVTYLRSKEARMEESEFSASAYDRVYDAVRPEIFFKSLPDKVVVPRRCRGHPARRAVERARAGARARHQFLGTHRRVHHRQRYELARHRRREPALPAASEDLCAILRGRAVDCRRARPKTTRAQWSIRLEIRAARSAGIRRRDTGRTDQATVHRARRVPVPIAAVSQRRRAADRRRRRAA